MTEQQNYTQTQTAMLRPGIFRGLGNMLTDYYGEYGRAGFVSGLRGDGAAWIAQQGGIKKALANGDDEFFRRFAERYEIPNIDRAKDIYAELPLYANEARMTIIKETMLEGSEDIFGLRNTVAIPSTSPFERIHRISHRNIDDIEQFELQAQGILSEVAAHIRTKSDPNKMRDSTLDLQVTLDDHLYRDEGDYRTEPVTLNVLHDNTTNHFRGRYDGRNLKKDTHVKTHNFDVRKIINGSPRPLLVLTQPRIKRISDGINKAVAKAYLNGKSIDPDDSVNDMIGIAFTTISQDPDKRDILMGKVQRILEDQRPDLENIIPDDKLDGRSDSGGNSWKRLKVQLKDVPDPIELIFYDLATHINCRFNIGIPGEKVVNRAHKLFQFQRSATLLPLYFPYVVYKKKYDMLGNMNDVLNEQYHRIRYNLLNARKSSVSAGNSFEYDVDD